MTKAKAFLLLTLLGIILSTATAFQPSIQPEKTQANSTSPAEFSVNIQNTDAVNHSYSISLLSPKSSWFYYPSAFRVESGEEGSFKMTVNPVKNALQQRYRFDMQIREQETGEQKELTGFFRVKQPYKLQITDMNINRENFRPGEVVETQIRIKNLDNQPVDQYKVNALYRNQSRTETGTSILPGGERLYDFSFRVDKDARPGKQYVNYSVELDGETVRESQHELTVSAVENISKNKSIQNKLLTYSESRTVRNTGNSPTNTSVTLQIPSYLESITSTQSDPDRIRTVKGETVYIWNTNLEPGQTYTAGYTVKYWVPLAGIVLLTAALVAIKKLGQSIYIKKTTEEQEGKIKVRIEIENNGEENIEDLELQEFIPDIATVEENFDMNAPRIRKTSQGTRLTWTLEDFQPGDQRVIQYTITPKLQVEEEVELEPAVIMQGDEKKVESNSASAEFSPDTT